MRAFDECPECGNVMDAAYTDCGDDDPECECDTAWDCVICGRKWWDPCDAHSLPYLRPINRIMMP